MVFNSQNTRFVELAVDSNFEDQSSLVKELNIH